MVLAAPGVPTESGTLTVACTDAPAAIVPRFCGKGVVVSAPILTPVSVTLDAAVPPVLVIVSWAITFPPERVKALVTTRLGDVKGGAEFTVIVVVALAVVKRTVSLGVKVTESISLLPTGKTVPAAGL